jgi:serine/threonine-protein kinase HipA
VGAFTLDDHGDLGFAYDQSWLDNPAAPPISQSLPKRPEPFGRRETRAFFAGLLPEEAQRDAVARSLGISPTNDFRLLEALGGDVAGALSLWPQDTLPPYTADWEDAHPLSDNELVELLDTLPSRPMLAGTGELRLSLAGAQQKLPVVMANGRIALPRHGQPTTHILKPPISRFPSTTENEFFSMRLAAAVGLDVAPVQALSVAGRSFLLVERYDREADEAGRTRRLHQEDVCQALGITPEHKYASEGGPGFKACFDLVRAACSAPAPAVLRLLDAAIFNVILGNADAHGKNFSLLYTGHEVRLAPLYDLMCTVAYPELSAKFSMPVAKRTTLDDFRPDTWDGFAEQIGMAKPYVRRRVVDLAKTMKARATELAETLRTADLAGDALDRYAGIVTARAIRLL